jgi:cell division protease FtsH
MRDFENAKDKVMMGTERKSMILSHEEKRNTAFHEAGHTLVAKLTPGTDPIHKVSIIPRGTALGVTQQLPIDDRYTYSKEYLLNTLAVLLGGRAAEEIALRHMTTGAGNDLEKATEIARKMVCEWGMSERLGPLTFGKREEQIFLGKEIAKHKDYSEKTAEEIDDEIKRIVSERYEYAKNLLMVNRPVLERLASVLLEKETLEAAEIDAIIQGKEIEADEPARIEKTVGPIPSKTRVEKEETTTRPAKPEKDMDAAPEAAV